MVSSVIIQEINNNTGVSSVIIQKINNITEVYSVIHNTEDKQKYRG